MKGVGIIYLKKKKKDKKYWKTQNVKLLFKSSDKIGGRHENSKPF